VEEAAEWRVIRYVEQNPVRAGMVETAAEYGWSSAQAPDAYRVLVPAACGTIERELFLSNVRIALEVVRSALAERTPGERPRP
jgi:hypothetical protein